MTVKRLFDVVFSILGLMILSPVFLIIYIFILFESGSPVIFRQERVGRNWKRFVIYKFRTMKELGASDQAGCTADNDKRVTKIGEFLRKYKLDEMPQLANVLRGDMSFVGPRPELQKFAEYYRAQYDRILKVRPGMTDLAAIKYRNEHTLLAGVRTEDVESVYLNRILPEKLGYSMEYLKRQSFLYDLELILQTISIVILK